MALTINQLMQWDVGALEAAGASLQSSAEHTKSIKEGLPNRGGHGGRGEQTNWLASSWQSPSALTAQAAASEINKTTAGLADLIQLASEAVLRASRKIDSAQQQIQSVRESVRNSESFTLRQDGTVDVPDYMVADGSDSAFGTSDFSGQTNNALILEGQAKDALEQARMADEQLNTYLRFYLEGIEIPGPSAAGLVFSTVLDFLPVIGTGKALIELMVGENIVTSQVYDDERLWFSAASSVVSGQFFRGVSFVRGIESPIPVGLVVSREAEVLNDGTRVVDDVVGPQTAQPVANSTATSPPAGPVVNNPVSIYMGPPPTVPHSSVPTYAPISNVPTSHSSYLIGDSVPATPIPIATPIPVVHAAPAPPVVTSVTPVVEVAAIHVDPAANAVDGLYAGSRLQFDSVAQQQASAAWARDTWQPTIDSLTRHETGSVEAYLDSGYVSYNNHLRQGHYGDGSVTSTRTDAFIDDIDSAIAKGVTPEDLVVVRATNEASFDRPMSELLGTTQSDAGFLSTSLGRKPVFSGEVNLYLRVPEGSHALYVEKLSEKPMERELLLPRDTQYVVTDVQVADNGKYIVIGEVVPGSGGPR